MQEYQCLNCRFEGIQKVSAIHGAGTWSSSSFSSTTTRGYSSSGSQYDATSSGSGFSMGSTQLAARLQPPTAPPDMRCGSTEVILYGLASLIFPPLVICWLSARRTEGHLLDTASQFRVAQWQQACAVWNRLWYCSRCDHVQDPDEGSVFPSEQMQRVLDSIQPEIVNNEFPPGMPVATPQGIGVVSRPNLDPLGLRDIGWRVVLLVAKPMQLDRPRFNCTQVVSVPVGLLRKVTLTVTREEADAMIADLKREQATLNAQ